jgi:signal transduction histidine kinase
VVGELGRRNVLGSPVSVSLGSSAHVLHDLPDALTVAAFVYLCYAVYRVFRAHAPSKAGPLAAMTMLLAFATLVDTINEHSVVGSLTTLYLTQLSFAAVIVAVSLGLRREAVQTENELRLYRTHMDALVEERVAELDHANALLAAEAQERRAAEEVLQRRVAELDALQRLAQILGSRAELEAALDEATGAVQGIFKAHSAWVLLLPDDAQPDGDAAPDTQPRVAGGIRYGATRDALAEAFVAAVADKVVETGAITADAPESWAGLPSEARAWAADEDILQVMALPLNGRTGRLGALVIARAGSDEPFSPGERQLAKTVGEAFAAVVEIDRLHRSETRQAAQEERQALARDLHDAVTQSLYGASLIAEALPAVWQREPAEGLRNLERLRRLVRAGLAEMRTLLFELRPSALEAAPLPALIDRLADSLGGQLQVPIEVAVDDVDLPQEVKLAFYRVTQEAFSNIAKHARAQHVAVAMHADHDVVTLVIRDDGQGFDPAAVSGSRMGLRIMLERLERVGARLTVDSAPGLGAAITAVWPQPTVVRAGRDKIGA